MTTVRPLPRGFAALLIAEMVLAIGATLLVLGSGLMFTDARTPAGDYLVLAGLGLAPALVAVGVAAGARALWRRGEGGVAIAVAALPLVLVVPLLAVLTGFAL